MSQSSVVLPLVSPPMSDVLRRKLGATRAPKKTGSVSVESLLRKTMPRDADAALSMELNVLAFTTTSLDKAELVAGLAENDLIYLVETGNGARGLAILDPGLVTAIIEVQVSGRISDKPPNDRVPTRTDAIVAGEIVDRWLTSAEEVVGAAGLDPAWPMAGFERMPGRLSEREVDLLLEPLEFRMTDIQFSLGGGAKTGQLRLAAPRLVPLLEGKETTRAARVRGHMPNLPVEMRAILARLPLGVTHARELKVDDLLPLPDGCLQHVRLETRQERLVREVHLGQLGGKKAVRLIDATSGETQGETTEQTLPKPLQSKPGNDGQNLLPAAPVHADGDGSPDLPELPALDDATCDG